MYSSVVKQARELLKCSLREFGALIGKSHTLVDNWEKGKTVPSYEDMFYLYLHTDNSVIGGMAATLMRELDPDRAAGDLARFVQCSPAQGLHG